SRGRNRTRRSFQGFDLLEGLLVDRALPVGHDLEPVQMVPLHHESQGPGRKPPFDRTRTDVHLDLELRVSRVEVRWRVIVVVHEDPDSEEATDLGHGDAKTGRYWPWFQPAQDLGAIPGARGRSSVTSPRVPMRRGIAVTPAPLPT